MGQSENNRLRTVAALALMRDGPDAKELSLYVSAGEAELLIERIDGLADVDKPETALPELIWQQLSSEKWNTLAEVHPAWILDSLSQEPPRIIGIIMRMLPSKHVRYILKEMDPRLRDRIPPMMESFAVATPVLNVVRQRFERRFMPMRISRDRGEACFDNLYYLRGEELEGLIHALGLAGFAMAFAQFEGKGMRAFLNRLELKDAKRIQRCMKEMEGVSNALARAVRFAILEADGGKKGPERMIFELGLAMLAMALDGGNGRLERLLEQRLHPSDGYLLRRFVIERRARTSHPITCELQNVILDLAGGLASEGRMDAAWARRETLPRDPALEAPAAFSSPSEDDTSTGVQQLA